MSYPRGYVLRRRTIRVVAAIAITSTCIALAEARVEAASAFVEPVFGLLVEPGKANYLPLAPDIARRCSLTATRYLVFAHIKDKAGDAYIVQDDAGTGSVGARVSPAGCTTVEVSWMLAGVHEGSFGAAQDVPGLPGDKAEKVCRGGMCHYVLRSSGEELLLKALLDNAVATGQQAHGGPAAFKAKACAPAVIRNAEDYPALRARLGSLCGL